MAGGAFWAVAAGLTLLVAASLVLTLLRGGRLQGGAAASADLQVYRDQLSEVERDLARGVIGADEAERLRTEVSRRVLEADRSRQAAAPARAGGRGTALMAALVVAVLAGSGALYARLGAPGYPDLPLQARLAASDAFRTDRPTQAEAEAGVRRAAQVSPDPEYAALLDKLRTAVKARPNDQTGLALLVRNEAQTGNFAAAYSAQGQLIAARGNAATAEDHAGFAELMILAANGYVSPEAEAALVLALQRDPANGTALYYSGLMFAQIGRTDRTFQLWRPLLERSRPGEPWVAPIRAQIADIAARAGETYAPPPAVPGPSAAEVEAAAAMTPEARAAMIEGMVAQLSDRLAREGGPASDWARLIAAYAVLGDVSRAAAIWTEAQGVFAGRADDLAALRAAALQAGVAQ